MKLKTLKSDLKTSKAMKYLMRTVGRKVMEKYYARAMGIAIVEQLEKMLDPEIIAEYGKTRNERMAINNYIRSHLSIFQANQYSSNGRRRKGGDVIMDENMIALIKQPNTNEKTHHCISMPYGASIRFKGRKYVSEHHSGFELTFYERKKEGKLIPKTYSISYMIDYCPFCGEKLIPRTHKPTCKCTLCEMDRVMTGK